MIIELPFSLPSLVVAARLRPLGGLAALVSMASGLRDDGRYSFFAASPAETSSRLLPEGSEAARPGHAGARAAPRWIGAVRYDGTARWARYEAAVRRDERTGLLAIEGDSSVAVRRLRDALETEAGPLAHATVSSVAFVDDAGTHLARIERALEHIRAGDIYQVNLARKIQFRHKGDELLTFSRMLSAAPTPFGAYLDLAEEGALLATSPELALAFRSGVLRNAPMKGTRPRGRDRSSDRANLRDLERSAKEEAELVMATDLHRNDLARVCHSGTVRVHGPPRVAESRTVFTRYREVSGRGTLSEAVLRSVLPAGSVTGAPKRRAIEIIAELEVSPRGYYTGAYGYVGRDGGAMLAMTIRTAHLARSGEGQYFAGGGIVIDSDPQAEVEETEWKAVQLLSLGSSKLAPIGPH